MAAEMRDTLKIKSMDGENSNRLHDKKVDALNEECHVAESHPEYYDKLNAYFPVEEMKHPLHLESLLKSEPYYHKQETDDYLLLYAKFPQFIFVDYLLVSGTTRGSGVGSKIIKALKAEGLPIILEVEAPSEDEPDTVSRRRFYDRHGFKLAKGLTYVRRDEEGQPYQLDILAWSPSGAVDAHEVYDWMEDTCMVIHNHKALEFYEEIPADPAEVLTVTSAAKA